MNRPFKAVAIVLMATQGKECAEAMKIKRTTQSPCSKRVGRFLNACRMSTFAALALAQGGDAAVVAENAAVTASMASTTGTESSPSVYVFDNYVKSFSSTEMHVGNVPGASWVRLVIRNGAQVSTASYNNRIGSDSASYTNAFNACVVTGAGTKLTMGSTRLGGMGPSNALIVEDGATATFTGDFYCGYRNSPVATNNLVLVDDATLDLGTRRLRLGYGLGHDRNALVVRNGGVLASSTGRIGVRWGKHCDFRVEGEGSLMEIGHAAADAIRLGESLVDSHHNTVTVADGGTVKITSELGTLAVQENPNEGGSGVRFAKGFFAVAGDRPTHIPPARAWLWNGDAWEPAPSDWAGRYFADEAEAAAAGRPGFGGYTVFTGGEPLVGSFRTTLMLMK